jgi:NADH dehydrogenase (ubiquinone) Fe-S protein 6
MAATDPSPPETQIVETSRIHCDGATGQPGSEGPRGAWSAGRTSAALGHPRVFLQIGADGYVECGYCDKRFVLKGGPADSEPSERSAPGPH